MPAPGSVYLHNRFYRDSAGNWRTKYLLILTTTPDGDLIFRLLTSRQYGRPKAPPCYHDDPYPGFYLGRLGGPLTSDSWLDLRAQDDYDRVEFNRSLEAGDLALVMELDADDLCRALECTASADDTTRQQERCMRNQRGALNCD